MPENTSLKIHSTTSRKEFHREYAGEIRLSDFDTTRPQRKNYPRTMVEIISTKQLDNPKENTPAN